VFASEIKRLIREAFWPTAGSPTPSTSQSKGSDKRTARVVFTAETVFGAIPIERTLNISV
jgi:hypothetical protein